MFQALRIGFNFMFIYWTTTFVHVVLMGVVPPSFNMLPHVHHKTNHGPFFFFKNLIQVEFQLQTSCNGTTLKLIGSLERDQFYIYLLKYCIFHGINGHGASWLHHFPIFLAAERTLPLKILPVASWYMYISYEGSFLHACVDFVGF